jgi:hypothetical protein
VFRPLLKDVSDAMMRKTAPAANPDAYVRALDGWRRDCVAMLRRAVRKRPPSMSRSNGGA